MTRQLHGGDTRTIRIILKLLQWPNYWHEIVLLLTTVVRNASGHNFTFVYFMMFIFLLQRMKRPGFLPSRGKKESDNTFGGGHAISTRHIGGFLPVRGRKSTDDNGYDLLEQQIHEFRVPLMTANYGGLLSLPLSTSSDNKRSVGFVGMRGRKSAADDETAAEEYWRHRSEWNTAQRADAVPSGANWYYPGFMSYG